MSEELPVIELSICVPVYNAEATIRRLAETLLKIFPGPGTEIVLVNDGSTDGSHRVCTALAEEHPEITYLRLRKNFGEHNAVMCALHHCRGAYAVIIDDDFQNPPEEIHRLLTEIRQGYDVVYSRYRRKRHSLFRNVGSKINDLAATALMGKPKDLYLSSFKIIRREVIDQIIRYTGPFPYIDGLILRVTSNIGTVLVEHHKRREGRSNYTLKKLLSLWLNMFINFSIIPLRIVTAAGLLTALACVVLAAVFIVEKLTHPETSLGWASIIVVVLFIGAVQMVFLGIMGEYIGKHYLDTNGTPQWVVKSRVSRGETHGQAD